jgi:hypothetical protein
VKHEFFKSLPAASKARTAAKEIQMEIGVYLCVSGLLWLLGLVFVARLRQRIGMYAALGCLFPPLALALYLVVPLWTGIYGTATVRPDVVSWGTYFERGGVMGVALLLLYVIGAFWPVFAAWLLNRQLKHQTARR